jgi:probable rRNA maturation factor
MSHHPPFDLTLTAATGREHVAYLRRHVRAAHGLLAPPLAELSLVLVGDKRMSDLHERFMAIPGPTDVLTFPLDEDARGRVTAGEVVVCVPEARRRMAEHGVTLRQELLLYAVHGLLHLCGFDDRTDREYRRMHRAEDDILARLGVGPVFDRSGSDRKRPGVRG